MREQLPQALSYRCGGLECNCEPVVDSYAQARPEWIRIADPHVSKILSVGVVVSGIAFSKDADAATLLPRSPKGDDVCCTCRRDRQGYALLPNVLDGSGTARDHWLHA